MNLGTYKELQKPTESMTVSKLTLCCLLTVFCQFLHDSLYSQNLLDLGINGQLEKSSGRNFRLIGGISISKKISEKIEIELEASYRTFIDSSFVILVALPPNSAGRVRYQLKHRFLTFPLLLTYKSRIINLSVGPTLDLFLGWKNLNYSAEPVNIAVAPLSEKRFDNKFMWGMKIKASKTIRLTKYAYLEPYVFLNPIFTKYSYDSKNHSYSNNFWGITVPLKFSIH